MSVSSTKRLNWASVIAAVVAVVPLVILAANFGPTAIDEMRQAAEQRDAARVAKAAGWASSHTPEGYRIIEGGQSSTAKLECPRCHGSGLADYVFLSDIGGTHEVHSPTTCPLCSGRGWILRMELYPQIR